MSEGVFACFFHDNKNVCSETRGNVGWYETFPITDWNFVFLLAFDIEFCNFSKQIWA